MRLKEMSSASVFRKLSVCVERKKDIVSTLFVCISEMASKVLSPSREQLFLGWYGTQNSMKALLSPAQVESILTAMKEVRRGREIAFSQYQRLLAATAIVIPLGLLYMRPFKL